MRRGERGPLRASTTWPPCERSQRARAGRTGELPVRCLQATGSRVDAVPHLAGGVSQAVECARECWPGTGCAPVGVLVVNLPSAWLYGDVHVGGLRSLQEILQWIETCRCAVAAASAWPWCSFSLVHCQGVHASPAFPQPRRADASGIVHLGVLTSLTLTGLFSYCLTVIVHPGEVPRDYCVDAESGSPSMVEVKRKRSDKGKTQSRFCSKCQLPKPPRAHHCRICKKCVLRMDHHCMWVNNCVGHRNYKFFLLFLAYSLAAILQCTGERDSALATGDVRVYKYL
eukprot:scaffold569_cov408-Prasinococcus_capsulatus_cf.AAC.5